MISSDKIRTEFKRIQGLGFIKSNRSHNTGIGKTFEDHLGVTENNSKDPDFEDFEVKSQREMSKSPITLFTKIATSPFGANEYLKNTFGKPDVLFPNITVLHTTTSGNKFNTAKHSPFAFKIEVDEMLRRLVLIVKDLKTDSIVSKDIYWDFKDIQATKLKNTFVVSAKTLHLSDDEYFHYTKARIYYDFSFEKMIEGIQNGYVKFEVRYGVYKSGPKMGQKHDHGCGFRVTLKNLSNLFDTFVEVE